MFDAFLFQLRTQGLKVGVSEWLRFLNGMERGLATDLVGLYQLGRALLVHSEAHYDLYDLAFSASFGDIQSDPRLAKLLEAWLERQKAFDPLRPPGEHELADFAALMEAFRRTLEAQRDRHQGGNRWVGTAGTSPYGTGGRANQGLQLGDENGGGGRGGIRLADQRMWQNYRTDQLLDTRDFKVALRALRKLAREGTEALDLDDTIDATAKSGGEIDLIFRNERINRVRVMLLMDSGGSMSPHTELVSRLFSAAKDTKTFKTLDHYYFHNCVYQWLYQDWENYDRKQTHQVLDSLTAAHRLIFVGDASMAPWELFTSASGYGVPAPSGLDWLKSFQMKCKASVWLNPDPLRFWDHPTVSAIGSVFRMYPLTLDGLRSAIQFLKSPT